MSRFFSFLCIFFLCLSFQGYGQKKDKKQSDDVIESSLKISDLCKREESVEKIKADVTPFKLDKISTQKIHYKSYSQVVEFAVPIYHSTKYKFIINSEGMPTNVDIRLSDKPHKQSSAKILKESSDKHLSYESPEDYSGTRIYVTIKIPADKEYQNDVRNRGCIVIGSGYSDLDF
ncbi:MAG: hypothetical protein KDC83_09955 [Flavobacteriales bacterium]|nr:hypothetical protein [Flavobacteriales bacterium]